jgi:hypothetical protein
MYAYRGDILQFCLSGDEIEGNEVPFVFGRLEEGEIDYDTDTATIRINGKTGTNRNFDRFNVVYSIHDDLETVIFEQDEYNETYPNRPTSTLVAMEEDEN